MTAVTDRTMSPHWPELGPTALIMAGRARAVGVP
jgi:hypothetical protein